MKSFCMFREEVDAPIFTSKYDFDTGLIDKIPDSKFNIKFPEYFFSEFDTPPNYGLSFDRSYYILALQATRGLFVTNFYDVGVLSVSKDNVYILFLENYSIKHYMGNMSDWKIFSHYNKTPIGAYKSIVVQLDVSQQFCFLYVDDNGVFLTSNGMIRAALNNIVSVDKEEALKGCVKAWRSGYDGILLDDGVRKEYKIVGHKIEYKV